MCRYMSSLLRSGNMDISVPKTSICLITRVDVLNLLSVHRPDGAITSNVGITLTKDRFDVNSAMLRHAIVKLLEI